MLGRADGERPGEVRADEHLQARDVVRGQRQHPATGSAEPASVAPRPTRAAPAPTAATSFGVPVDPEVRTTTAPEPPSASQSVDQPLDRAGEPATRPQRPTPDVGRAAAVPTRVGARAPRPTPSGRPPVRTRLRHLATVTTTAQWIEGARPRTLPAAISPVVAGTGGRRPRAPAVVVEGAARARRRARAADRRSTTPTTTPTASAAPTTTASGRCAWSAREPRRPAAVKAAAFASFGVAAAGRAGARGDDGVVADRGRCGGDRRRLVLHRRLEAVRLPGSRRGRCLRVLRAGRRARDDLRADRGRHARRPSGSRCGIGALACAILVANNLRDIASDSAGRQAHPGGRRSATPGHAPRLHPAPPGCRVVRGLAACALTWWALLALGVPAAVLACRPGRTRGARGRALIRRCATRAWRNSSSPSGCSRGSPSPPPAESPAVGPRANRPDSRGHIIPGRCIARDPQEMGFCDPSAGRPDPSAGRPLPLGADPLNPRRDQLTPRPTLGAGATYQNRGCP